MRERRRKLSPLSGPVLVLASAVICITSLGHGLTWTTASDRSQFRNWLGGPHPPVGWKGFARTQRTGTAAMVVAKTTAMTQTAMPAAFSARLSRWKTEWGSASIADY